MKIFKKMRYVASAMLAVAILFSSVFMTGCLDLLSSESSRIDFVVRNVEEIYANDNIKYDVLLTATYFENGETYELNGDFTECYDMRNSSDIAYSRVERKNDFTGMNQSYVYVDGYMYLLSEAQKIKAKFSSYSEMYANIDGYFLYYESDGTIKSECPEPVDGIYTLKQTHSYGAVYEELYQNLNWLIPSSMYNGSRITSFVETFKYDQNTKEVEYTADIVIAQQSGNSNNSITIKWVEKVSLKGFEVEAPDDADSYTDVGNYAVLSDVVIAVNNHYDAANGKFKTTRKLNFTGAINDQEKIVETIEYKTDANGIFTFDWKSEYENSELSNVSNSTYDGTVLITEAMGSKTQTPVSQGDAYSYISYYKDPFWIDRSIAEKIEKVIKNGNNVTVTIDPTDYFLKYVAEEELIYYMELPYDRDSLSVDGVCEIVYIDDAMFEFSKEDHIKLHSIKITLQASFILDGVESTLDYEYYMQVNRQD